MAYPSSATGSTASTCWPTGLKMAKSAGNEFILADLEERGFDPLAFRYLCFTVRYRHRMNFTFSALRAGERALTSLRDRVWEWRGEPAPDQEPPEAAVWRGRFNDALDNDLDMPRALGITWDMIRSDLPGGSKLALLLEFDRIFGLDLEAVPERYALSASLEDTIARRHTIRAQQEYGQADRMRSELVASGYRVGDARKETRVRPKTELEKREERWNAVSSSREVKSLLDLPPALDYSVVVIASNYIDDVKRCTEAILKWVDDGSTELIVVDNGSTDGTSEWLEGLSRSDPRVRVVYCAITFLVTVRPRTSD